MSGPLVDVRQVSKVYRLWSTPSSRLGAMLLEQTGALPLVPRAIRGKLAAGADRLGPQFHALSDVSFSLQRGESLGIIGRNGSGKSTLLQILAGTLQPSSGSVRLSGRVAALLELGSGFNPEFTGRENVLLQAALLGFSRRDALDRMGEVEEFAAIGEFIDQPTKVYSSGMLVRLAFATQTILAPELFIVDEALAVGDVFFQARCARFFEERLKTGMSLILVSHDLLAVKAMCQRTIVLHGGKVSFFGPSAEAISHYHHLYRGRRSGRSEVSSASAKPEGQVVRLPEGAKERNWNSPQELGTREAEIVCFRLLNEQGVEATAFELHDEMKVEIYVRTHQPVDDIVVGFEISNRLSQVIFGVTSVHTGTLPFRVELGCLYRCVFTVKVRMGVGDFVIDAAVGSTDRGDGAPQVLLHRVTAISTLSVRHPGRIPSFFGHADLEAKFQVQGGSSVVAGVT